MIESVSCLITLLGKNLQAFLLLRYHDTANEGNVVDVLDVFEGQGQDLISHDYLTGCRSVTPKIPSVSVFRVTKANLELACVLELSKIVAKRGGWILGEHRQGLDTEELEPIFDCEAELNATEDIESLCYTKFAIHNRSEDLGIDEAPLRGLPADMKSFCPDLLTYIHEVEVRWRYRFATLESKRSHGAVTATEHVFFAVSTTKRDVQILLSRLSCCSPIKCRKEGLVERIDFITWGNNTLEDHELQFNGQIHETERLTVTLVPEEGDRRSVSLSEDRTVC
jgi:hypothetical protein